MRMRVVNKDYRYSVNIFQRNKYPTKSRLARAFFFVKTKFPYIKNFYQKYLSNF